MHPLHTTTLYTLSTFAMSALDPQTPYEDEKKIGGEGGDGIIEASYHDYTPEESKALVRKFDIHVSVAGVWRG